MDGDNRFVDDGDDDARAEEWAEILDMLDEGEDDADDLVGDDHGECEYGDGRPVDPRGPVFTLPDGDTAEVCSAHYDVPNVGVTATGRYWDDIADGVPSGEAQRRAFDVDAHDRAATIAAGNAYSAADQSITAAHGDPTAQAVADARAAVQGWNDARALRPDPSRAEQLTRWAEDDRAASRAVELDRELDELA